jgi:hypothetical protein
MCEQTMHVLWKTRSHRYQLPQETTNVYNLSHFHSHTPLQDLGNEDIQYQ